MPTIALHRAVMLGVIGFGALTLGATGAQASCDDLPEFDDLLTELTGVVDDGGNAGLANEMWGTIVDRDGIVCAVAFTGEELGDQWPGSRVISAQKANTANAFSLPADAGFGGALSSGNLYATVLEDGTLLGLQFSNPVDPAVAYAGDPATYGTEDDPMVGQKIGGVNVFGGGLALYDRETGELLGGLGVSGDTSCTDHVVAWRTRFELGLDQVPGGVSNTGDDNLIIKRRPKPSTFQHPNCGGGVKPIIEALPVDYPIGGE